MRQKKAVTRELQNRYQKARKKEKIIILNEFTQLTGYNRSYASQILNQRKVMGYTHIAGQNLKYMCEITKKSGERRNMIRKSS